MKKVIVILVCTLCISLNLIAQENQQKEFNGFWEGKIKFGTVSLRLVLKTFLNEDGSAGAFLDSPDQSANNIPLSFFTLSDDSLKFTIKELGASYLGKLEKDSMTAVGTFSQSGMKLPLNFKKVDKVTEVRRPQTPLKPFPYNEEEIVFENTAAKINLAGTLTYPSEGNNFPAVILITGSGAQDRDETIFNHKPFLVIADHLTRNGIAVLRYDDRGIGKSGGNPSAATTADFVTDVLAAVDFLKTRVEIDKSKIGLLGHSEGGMIAPMAAASSNDIAFIVMLAGPGITGKDILLLQTELILRAEGTEESKIEERVNKNKKIYDIISYEADSSSAYKILEELYNSDYADMTEEEKADPNNSRESFERNVKIILSPWFRFFLKFDPKPYLETVTIPVLALNGEKDLQVPPKENLSAIEASLKSAGNTNFITKELPGLNHLFQTSKTGSVSEYGQIEETFSVDALKIISDWIISTIKK